MKFNKSYRLLNFLNRKHSLALRYFFALSAYLFVLLFGRSRILAKASARDFIEDDFKVGFRRLAWFGRKCTPSANFIEDHYFDFTVDLTSEEKIAIERFLDRKKQASDYEMDTLYLMASDIHEEVRSGNNLESLKQKINLFYDTADRVVKDKVIESGISGYIEKKIDREGDFNKEDAVEALHDFAALLPISEWNWYVISGTFLGLHREGGFLSHDYDIDVGLDGDSKIILENLIDKLSESSVFELKKIDSHLELLKDESGSRYLNESISLLKLVHHNGLNIDIFIHYNIDGVVWHGSVIHRWENTAFELELREFEGLQVMAPKNADLYLTENYGDWRTPKTEFDCTTGTPNLVVSKNFLSTALFVKKLVYTSISSQKEYMKLKKVLIQSGVISHDEHGMKMVRSL